MSNPSRYRPDLPDIPARMLTLPVTRGFPTPWFVGKVNGEYDFRFIGEGKLARAVKERRCWVFRMGGPSGHGWSAPHARAGPLGLPARPGAAPVCPWLWGAV